METGMRHQQIKQDDVVTCLQLCHLAITSWLMCAVIIMEVKELKDKASLAQCHLYSSLQIFKVKNITCTQEI